MKKESETGIITNMELERIQKYLPDIEPSDLQFTPTGKEKIRMPKVKNEFDEKVFMEFLRKKETDVEKMREKLGVTVGNLERRVLKAFMKNKTLVYEIEFPEPKKPNGKKNTDYSELKSLIEEKKSFPEIREHYGIDKTKSVSLRNKVNECCAKHSLPWPKDMTETRSKGEWLTGDKVLAVPMGFLPESWKGEREKTGKTKKDKTTGVEKEITLWHGKKVKGSMSEDGLTLTISLAQE